MFKNIGFKKKTLETWKLLKQFIHITYTVELLKLSLTDWVPREKGKKLRFNNELLDI